MLSCRGVWYAGYNQRVVPPLVGSFLLFLFFLLYCHIDFQSQVSFITSNPHRRAARSSHSHSYCDFTFIVDDPAESYI